MSDRDSKQAVGGGRKTDEGKIKANMRTHETDEVEDAYRHCVVASYNGVAAPRFLPEPSGS